MKVLSVIGLVLSVSSLGHVAWAADDLYRCADGTFTNRVERQCERYESTGVLRVQEGPVEAVKSPVKGDEDKQPFAELKLFQESVKPQVAVPHR